MKSLLIIAIALFSGLGKNFAQITVSKNDVSCHGCTDGSATVSVSGGTPPYEFIWPDGSSTPSVFNLAPGYYVVVIVDANGCSGSASVTINDVPKPPDPFKISIVASADPNDITGPAGYGEPKWVSVHDELPYRIRFENDPKLATAAVNKVVITHKIDDMANMFSFRLGEFSFRNFTFQVPPNSSHYFKRINLVDTIGVYLDVTAGIDVTKRQAFWIFQAFDPITGLPNINPDLGFLPINDTITRNGEGSVNFTIKPISTAHTGDTIKAFANIVFDINAPILTNTAFNTIDAKPPLSKINSINRINSDIVEISWTGNDDPMGSGIDDYNLLISSGNEPYIMYADITDNMFTVNLPGGNEYRIQSVAKDHTNNTEKIKSEPDTILFIKPVVKLGDDRILCLNDSVVLSAGSGFDSYLWNDGSVGKTLTVKSAGKYYVKAVNDTISASDTIVITANDLPMPSLHNNNNVLCDGASVFLDAGQGFMKYLWNTGEITHDIEINQAGKYAVNVTDKNGCPGQDSITIELLSKPEVSLGNDLYIENHETIVLVPQPGNYINYLWNDNSINDSLQISGKIAGAGTHEYWVKVTGANDCSNSDTISVSVSVAINIEFENLDQTSINFYPNPAIDLLNVRITGIESADLKLEIINIEGSVMLIKQYKNSKTIVTDQIDMSNFAPGPYIFRVGYKDSEISGTVIKQ